MENFLTVPALIAVIILLLLERFATDSVDQVIKALMELLLTLIKRLTVYAAGKAPTASVVTPTSAGVDQQPVKPETPPASSMPPAKP